MKFLSATTLAALLASAPMLLEAKEPATGPVTFNASVLVDVDAHGKPVRVEAPQDLPEPIRNFIEKRVASWQYQPAKVGGVPQPATTYVSVNACAVPVSNGYKMGLDYQANGPRSLNDRRLAPPQYPPSARHAGTEADFVLILDIDTDGHAKLATVEKAEFRGRGGSSDFEPLLRRWAKTLRFDVEHLGNKPVTAKVRMPVEFTMGNRVTRRELINEFLTKANASRECQIAAGTFNMKPVAMDSVLKVTPIPAG